MDVEEHHVRLSGQHGADHVGPGGRLADDLVAELFQGVLQELADGRRRLRRPRCSGCGTVVVARSMTVVTSRRGLLKEGLQTR